jgi:hypothetical protein
MCGHMRDGQYKPITRLSGKNLAEFETGTGGLAHIATAQVTFMHCLLDLVTRPGGVLRDK